MAIRGARLPKFTLFTGPNCSLCDTAKSALAKVRQSRPFQLDTINIQDPGQEKWKKKYVYWIPALHLEDKEVVKGRWDEKAILQALKSWDQNHTQGETGVSSYYTFGSKASTLTSTPFFYHSNPGPYSHSWEQSGVYQRGISEDEGFLGHSEDETVKDDIVDTNNARCFNCGDPEHKVPDCPSRPNRDLIALSRQFYYFFQGNLPQWKRFHVVESWKYQRLDWLDEFEPGQIRGDLLGEALEDSNGELFKNICAWGYPPGWVCSVDPRNSVRTRIWSQNEGAMDLENEEIFEIYGEGDSSEHLPLSASVNVPLGHTDNADDKASSTLIASDDTSDEETNKGDTHPVRWATYPNDYFSSSHLFVYTTNPSLIPSTSWDDTSFENTLDYLHQHQPKPPPPPSEEPPPLPPSPLGHPPPPSSSPLLNIISPSYIQEPKLDALSKEESDMELSDGD
ncbi:hypothetical protein CPB83DRAFT_807425 [Crepidotus variabilis]|uniref:CCHC-type domain-containing protein n=1 Tax=Crepidotus variabilis TaxID=179855 RepID=A0A9P6JTX3_9AGAR|nr:hypothetical protein CPB83DRAFT_807425 [Crepidotus variabilis]